MLVYPRAPAKIVQRSVVMPRVSFYRKRGINTIFVRLRGSVIRNRNHFVFDIRNRALDSFGVSPAEVTVEKFKRESYRLPTGGNKRYERPMES